MPENDFDQKIGQKQIELDRKLEALEAIRQEFLPMVAAAAADWWEKAARNEVERNTAVTDKLSDEELGALKADIGALINEVNKHVEEFFSDDTAWWHLKNEKNDYVGGGSTHTYYWYDRRAPDEITKPYRLLLGKLAPILERRGYIKDDSRGHGVWREYDGSGNYHPPNARPYYPFNIDCPPSWKPVVERYQNAKTEAQQTIGEIRTLEREKKEARAKKRWDSV